MKPVRLYGDPFASGGAAQALRATLAACNRRGFRVSLCLSAVRSDAQGAALPLGTGAQAFAVGGDLSADAIEALQRAVATPVPATAPVLVFAPRRWREELLALAGLEWPRACAVLAGGIDSADELLNRAEAELRWAGTEDPAIGNDLAELEAWSKLPPPPLDGAVLHAGAEDPAAGSDVAVRAFLRAFPHGDRRLRVVLPAGAENAAAALANVALQEGGPEALSRIEFSLGELQPALAADCAACLQPMRRLLAGAELANLLASGRPVVATRYHATASALGAPGTCLPVGGMIVQGEDGLLWCEPNLDNVVAGLQAAVADGKQAAAMGQRARHHAQAELSLDRPAAPPSRAALRKGADGGLPVVVLEAPFFETSSSSELSIETAKALLRRGDVELKLVPTAPFRADMDLLRNRAPELCAHLSRDPGKADLWLSAGWPPRTQRPECRTFALRLDWEYGALPSDLQPVVAHEADLVVVHSRHVERTVAAAGCPSERIVRIPHGVDGAVFHEECRPDPDLLAFKGDLPLVLFVGGMVFRKGFDVLLRMALDASQQGARFVLAVKAVGHDQHYAGYHMAELARRMQATPGAPPLCILDGDMDRQKLASVYAAADLYCQPYRGEGFCMPALEARACGLPVLVTRGGATDDFCQGPGAVRLPSARRIVELNGSHVSMPWVLEPDAAEAGRILRQSLHDLPALKAAARAEAASVRARWTWDAAAAAIAEQAHAAAAVSKIPTLVAL